MKKSMWSKLSLITLTGSILMSSCASFLEDATEIQQVTASEVLVAPESSTDLNARKATERNYFETFTNQLVQVDENGEFTSSLPAYFPGSGVGNSSYMGKSYTFLNQYAFFGADGFGTIGAPVTQFYSKKLEELGIIISNPDVSSVTTDGKGNSVWFKNIQNQVTPVREDRSNFKADVEIIGGTGKFKNATGTGTVNGYFNPTNGEGKSTIKGRIVY